MGQVCVLNPDQESRQKAHRHWPQDIRLVKTLVAPACTTHTLYIGRHIHSCLVTIAECRQTLMLFYLFTTLSDCHVIGVGRPLSCGSYLHSFIACWSLCFIMKTVNCCHLLHFTVVDYFKKSIKFCVLTSRILQAEMWTMLCQEMSGIIQYLFGFTILSSYYLN